MTPSLQTARPMPAAPAARALGTLAQAGMFVFGIVMALIGAVVPSLSERLPMTLGDVGTLFLVMNFAMLVASLVVGLIMDRGGLKVPIAAGAGLVALGLLLVGGAASYAPVLLAVACLGFGGGAINAGANTLVADLHEDPDRKAAALNLLGVFFGFGALMLPFTLAALTSRFGAPRLLYGAALLCLVLAAAAAALTFPAPKRKHGWPLADMTRFIRVPMIGAFALLLFFQSGNEFLLGGYISAYLTRELRVPVAEASYWLAGYWASLMLARLILSRVVLKVGAPAVVTGGAVLAAAGALAIGSARTAGPAVASVFLTGFALAGIFPGVLGITGARFREHSGTVFGILFTVALCGGMTIPWLAGHLAEAAGMGWVFVLAAANFAVVAMLSLAARRPAA